MKTTELRIGNFISINFGNCDDGKIITVDGISDCEIYNEEHGYSPCNEFKPIPLTEQWLLDFGFEDEGGDDYVVTKGEHTLLLTVEKDSVRVYLISLYGTYNSEYTFLKDILYVHQLQNLYFALTQEELVLKRKALLEGLEAENIEEYKHIVSNWHFLPKLPEVNVEVLIAYKYDKKPIQGYWNGKKWIGSFETRDYMNDGFVRDETLNVPEYIYAWAELPDCPEVPTPF